MGAINGHILSIKRWAPSIEVNEVLFNMVPFWDQVHDLGYEKFNSANARRIGDRMD